VLYRPSCTECAACLSARIRVADFAPRRSQKRVMKRNESLVRSARSAWATEEQYALFRRYLDARHADGGMADMDVFEFAAMIEETPVKTRVVEYRDQARDDALTAVCLTDILDDGLSLVYSFFDPQIRAQLLGTYVIMDHVALAREAGLPYVYLGYWVPGSDKMGYKAQFQGLEVYFGGEWQRLGDPAEYSNQAHPLSIDPIAQQVAQINLPDLRGAD
jgi:arginyl-tRNA--protein-N-Asp/Glu arginylyltransferase